MDRIGSPVNQAAETSPWVAGIGPVEILVVLVAIVVTLAAIVLGVVWLSRRRAAKQKTAHV